MEITDTNIPASNPKSISVAMASYNGEAFLKQQIQSITQQSLPPVEIFVSDDRSQDTTVAILESCRIENRIRYHVNEHRLGVIRNFKNAVAKCADTDFTALADQDDIWLTDKLEKSTAKLLSIDSENIPAMVYSDLVVIDKNENVLNKSFWNELGHDSYTHCFQTLLFGNFVTGCTILMNRKMRSCFAEMPSDVLMHDAWLALIAFSFGKAAVVKEPLVKYRRHESNVAMVSSFRKKSRAERWLGHIRRILKKDDTYLSEQFGLLKKFLSVYHHQLTEDQKKILTDFLKLEHKSFFRKKRYEIAVLSKYRI